jgi:spore coat polysaccharide biosynthesis protein SpsF (cytidylyltransferase family)
MLDHVIHRVKKSSNYLNKNTHRTGKHVRVFLLVPENDYIKTPHRAGVVKLGGNEHDVLSRYVKMQDNYPSQYIVRVTADCPLIKAPLITKAINTAIANQYDYLSNTYPEYRTFYDGTDVEVISERLLNHLNKHAMDSEREHVTSLLHRKDKKINWANFGLIINEIDESETKLSVDTQEDLDNVSRHHFSIQSKVKAWGAIHGEKTIHRF